MYANGRDVCNSDSKTPAILNIMTKTEQSLFPGFSLFSLLPLGLEAREPSLSSSSNDVLGWAWGGSDIGGETARMCQD